MTKLSREWDIGEKKLSRRDNSSTDSWNMSYCLSEGFEKDSLVGADVRTDEELQAMKLLQ